MLRAPSLTCAALRAARAATLPAGALLLAACGGARSQPVGPPVADPAALAASIQQASIPASPRQGTFAWTLDEQGSRVRGRGVVRLVAPERLRIDLFGLRGETYLAAALVAEEFRLPAAAQGQAPLPSPMLLWGALGILRPPAGAVLESAAASDSVSLLRYRVPGGDAFEVRARGGGEALRLAQVERIGRSGVLESVRLEYAASGELERTRYRDVAAFRELVLELENIRDVSSFPNTIWTPDAAER